MEGCAPIRRSRLLHDYFRVTWGEADMEGTHEETRRATSSQLLQWNDGYVGIRSTAVSTCM